MEVTIIPFDAKYLAETLAMMRQWSPVHPELGERSLYDWQRCTRYLALAGGKVVGHIAQIAHEFRYANGRTRSEEHTSELQSQSNLVCRLLLEKKKKKKRHNTPRQQTPQTSRPRRPD